MKRYSLETPPCGGPSIVTPPIFVFEVSNVPWELETEKTCTVNNTVEAHFYLVCIKRQSFLSVIINVEECAPPPPKKKSRKILWPIFSLAFSLINMTKVTSQKLQPPQP
jgi:hypothetical protein